MKKISIKNLFSKKYLLFAVLAIFSITFTIQFNAKIKNLSREVLGEFQDVVYAAETTSEPPCACEIKGKVTTDGPEGVDVPVDRAQVEVSGSDDEWAYDSTDENGEYNLGKFACQKDLVIEVEKKIIYSFEVFDEKDCRFNTQQEEDIPPLKRQEREITTSESCPDQNFHLTPNIKIEVLYNFNDMTIGDYSGTTLEYKNFQHMTTAEAIALRRDQNYPEVSKIKMTAYLWNEITDEFDIKHTNFRGDVSAVSKDTICRLEINKDGSCEHIVERPLSPIRVTIDDTDETSATKFFSQGEAIFNLRSDYVTTIVNKQYGLVEFIFTNPSEEILFIDLDPNSTGVMWVLYEKKKDNITLKITQHIDHGHLKYDPEAPGLEWKWELGYFTPDLYEWMGLDVIKDPKNKDIVLGKKYNGDDFTVADMFSYVRGIRWLKIDALANASLAETRIDYSRLSSLRHFRYIAEGRTGYTNLHRRSSRVGTFSHEFHHNFWQAAYLNYAQDVFGQEEIDKDGDYLLAENYFDIFKYLEDSKEKGFGGDGYLEEEAFYDNDRKKRVLTFIDKRPWSEGGRWRKSTIAVYDSEGVDFYPGSDKIDFYERTAYISKISLAPKIYNLSVDPMRIFSLEDKEIGKGYWQVLPEERTPYYDFTDAPIKLSISLVDFLVDDPRINIDDTWQVEDITSIKTLEDAEEYDADRFSDFYLEEINK